MWGDGGIGEGGLTRTFASIAEQDQVLHNVLYLTGFYNFGSRKKSVPKIVAEYVMGFIRLATRLIIIL